MNQTPASADRTREALPVSSVAEVQQEGVIKLPCGYVDDDGALHTEVELEPLTGRDEEFLGHLGARTSAAQVVTRLLSQCLKRVGAVEQIDATLIRNLLVSDREYLMIKLREVTFGTRVDVVLYCPNLACGKPMDVRIFLDDIRIERQPIPARYLTMELSPAASVIDAEGREHRLVEFRLPTGADQEELAPQFRSDEMRASNQLLARCIRRIGELKGTDEGFFSGLSDLTRSEIESQMKRETPRTEIELSGVCPECDLPFEAPFNFMDFFSAETQKNPSDLEQAVHVLAWHYHWSEEHILSLTRKKRTRYLELVQEELRRFD